MLWEQDQVRWGGRGAGKVPHAWRAKCSVPWGARPPRSAAQVLLGPRWLCGRRAPLLGCTAGAARGLLGEMPSPSLALGCAFPLPLEDATWLRAEPEPAARARPRGNCPGLGCPCPGWVPWHFPQTQSPRAEAPALGGILPDRTPDD